MAFVIRCVGERSLQTQGLNICILKKYSVSDPQLESKNANIYNMNETYHLKSFSLKQLSNLSKLDV